MRLTRITENELLCALFINTPSSWSLAKSREALEEIVRLLGWDDLNPASVWHGLTELNKRLYSLPKTKKGMKWFPSKT